MSAIVTVVRDPSAPLGKHFAADGTKRSAVTIGRGVATQYEVATAEAMGQLLTAVQQDCQSAIVLSSFPGIPVGQEFDLLSESELRQLTGQQDVRATVFQYPNGRYCTGRFIERVKASSWLLLDRDCDGQTPEHLSNEKLPFEGWILAMDALLPGVSTAPRVHVPSSSARIVWPDGQVRSSGNGHTFVLTDGTDAERLKAAAEANAIRYGLAWRWHNKNGASSIRTLCDLSVWTPGRLVFDGAPTADAPLRVLPPQIAISNAERAPLATSTIASPTSEEFRELTRLMGTEKVMRNDGRGGLDAYDLPAAALIETEDYGAITLEQAQQIMVEEGVEKIRCQTPFRESVSMAGVLRIGGDGKPALYDVGTGTTHWLRHEDYCAAVGFGQGDLPAGASAEPVARQPSPEQVLPPAAEPWANRFSKRTKRINAEPGEAGQRRAVIYQLISEKSINTIWGTPGAGKSFVAAAIARSVATGQPFVGKPTARGRVLYISTEGDIRKRFAADGLDGLDNIDTYEDQLNLASADDVAELIQHIATEGYSLVIYDVFVECFIGDENSTEDMALAVRGLRAVRDATGAAQLVVHHSNKAGEAMRGSSVLLGATDNELKIVREEKTDRRLLAVAKCRDGRDYYDLSFFDIESVDLGPDQDPIAPAGARLTAARIKWVTGQQIIEARIDAKCADQRAPISDGGKWVQKAHDVLKRSGADGLAEHDWLAQFSNEVPLAEGSIKTTFRRAVTWLSQSEYIRAEIGGGGCKVFKMAHRDEIASTGGFAAFADGVS